MRWQEVDPHLVLETLQEEGLLGVAPMAIDNEVTPLAVILGLRLGQKDLTEPQKGYIVARPTGKACGEPPGLEVIVI